MSHPETNPFESPTGRTAMPPRERNLGLRILFGFLWFFPIWLLSNFMIGAIIGGIAGAQTQSAEEGARAGAAAAQAFYEQYQFIVLAGQVLFTVALGWFGKLPGTGKLLK